MASGYPEDLKITQTANGRVQTVALYARVSTDDKDQDPETQVYALKDYCERREWVIEGEPYIDYASAKDLARREAWRLLMQDASRREFDLVLVYRLDRAFRTVRDGVLALDQLKHCGVGFASISEPFIDTTSPMGELMFTISAAWAQLEGAIISQRVRAGMDRAKAQGVRIGRPTVPVDLDYVVRQRAAGLSWTAIHRGHPVMTMESGRRKKPAVSTIRKAYRLRRHPIGELPMFPERTLHQGGSANQRVC